MKTQPKPWFPLVSSLLLLTAFPGLAQAGEMKRDYEFSTPLPQTKRVTIRRPIAALPANQRFDRCPAQSRLEEFAESTSFLVMVCRDDRNNMKRFWIQKAKKTGAITKLTWLMERGDPYRGWTSGDYSVSIYADGRNPEKLNAYLESFNTRTKQGKAEALIYHYSRVYDRRP
jgi:hypothetical protein